MFISTREGTSMATECYGTVGSPFSGNEEGAPAAIGREMPVSPTAFGAFEGSLCQIRSGEGKNRIGEVRLASIG